MKGLKNVLSRFFNNSYSRADYLKMKELVQSDDSRLEDAMRAHWEEFQHEPLSAAKDLTSIQQLVIKRKASATFSSGARILHFYSKVAAVLVLPLMLALGYFYFKMGDFLQQQQVFVEISSPAGARTSLNLPDGSAVWLNGNSQIRYPADFKQNRLVQLQGEALFQVHSDAKHPFLVQFHELTVKATGTKFNVNAYDESSTVAVILEEGKVQVYDTNGKVKQLMTPGHELNFEKKTASMDYSKKNVSAYTEWANGRLVFENAPMSEVVSRLSHWYGIAVEIRDPELERLHFKATFENESLEEALKLLQSTSTFNYRFDKRHIEADGSAGKPRVIITKNRPM